MARKRATAEPPVEQGHLPDMAPPRIKAIDNAARIYYAAVQDRLIANKDEDEAKDNLIDLMKEHDQTIYEAANGLVVTLTATSNVKVKPAKKAGTTNGDGEEDGDDAAD